MACGRWGCHGASYIPMSVGIIMMSGLVITYIVAVLKGHVETLLPYISDTGVDIPESSIFAQFLNVTAVLALFTMYLRYRLVQDITQGMDSNVSRLSRVNLVIGVISSMGLSIVGNFQETKIEVMHFTGAALVFIGGLLYMLLDSILSYRMCPAFCGRYICHVRTVIAAVGISSLFITIIAGGISRQQWPNTSGRERLHWDVHDPGYPAHLISTFGEWFMAFSFLVYFFTYIRDFQKIDFEVKTYISVSHLDEEPIIEPGETSRLLA